MKLLYWDGQGFCLYYKVLQKGRFPLAGGGGGRRPSDERAARDAVGGHRLEKAKLGRAARAGGMRASVFLARKAHVSLALRPPICYAWPWLPPSPPTLSNCAR